MSKYCLLLAFAASAVVCAAQGLVEKRIMQMERDLAQASMKADAATMSRLESDHVVMLMPDGSVHGKTQDIEESKNGTFKCEAMDVHDMKVDVHGNTAIVTGRTTLKNAKYGNQDVSGEYQFVDTWMSNGGQWQLVAAAAAGLKH